MSVARIQRPRDDAAWAALLWLVWLAVLVGVALSGVRPARLDGAHLRTAVFPAALALLVAATRWHRSWLPSLKATRPAPGGVGVPSSTRPEPGEQLLVAALLPVALTAWGLWQGMAIPLLLVGAMCLEQVALAAVLWWWERRLGGPVVTHAEARAGRRMSPFPLYVATRRSAPVLTLVR